MNGVSISFECWFRPPRPHKGPFKNDVSGEGEGGGWPISDDRRRRLRDLYTKNSDKGGEGVQNL